MRPAAGSSPTGSGEMAGSLQWICIHLLQTIMPTTHFAIPAMTSPQDAQAVMFELQDLPCIHVADVDLERRTAWAEHTAFISPEEIADALAEAGYPATVLAG